MTKPAILISVVVVIGLATTTLSVCQVGQIATASIADAKPIKPEGSAKVKKPPKTEECATAGFLPMEASRPATAHHTVILSWNAGASSLHAPAGYCLYKSETEIDIKNPKCSGCEPVNSVPLSTTSCVDDIVKDGVTYYYVVRAVDSTGSTSAWSNLASAPVPASDQVKPSSTAPPPLCRVPPPGR
jgi:hypothetical protein